MISFTFLKKICKMNTKVGNWFQEKVEIGQKWAQILSNFSPQNASFCFSSLDTNRA